MAELQERMIRAAKLDIALYEEVETDPEAMNQATAVVTISAVAAGLGNLQVGGLMGLVAGTVGALIAWYVWAYLTYFIGAKFVPEPQTNTTPEQLLRTIGFANAPGIIRVLAFIPGMAPLVFGVAGVWTLVATVIAVRQALNYESTWRAIGVCVLGWLLQGLVVFFLLSFFIDLPG
jgi:hypothetical protein